MACAACALVFIAIRTGIARDGDVPLAHWGWRPADKIYNGDYWALVTSVFAHVDFLHLSFNLYWLYFLGRGLERTIGSWRWLGFFLGAAMVSSGVELAVSGSTAIGASGVASALFGFMWVTRKRVRTFARILDSRTVITFLSWLVVCLVLTISKFWAFGNAAHIAGLLYGSALGAWVLGRPPRPLMSAAIAVLLLAAVVPMFWAPWSMSWTSWRGVRAYMKDDFTTAIQWYERSLKLGRDKVWCLQRIALSHGRMGNEPAFREVVENLRALDEGAAEEMERAFTQDAR